VTTAVAHQGRTVRLGAHPVGLDLERIRETLTRPRVRAAIRRLGKDLADRKVVVCAERLDYMKGPEQKLLAFERFLAERPEWREKITFINICTPPSDGMEVYREVRQRVEQAAGKINGRFATATWTPLAYMFRRVPFDELAAYLAVADVGWITPLRDGLNLVAKEYVAIRSQSEESGVLILSRFAGAAVELDGVLVTNPHDPAEMADTLGRALVMAEGEQAERLRRLAATVREHDVRRWADDFVRRAREGA
jgi:glucosylglycerol-phosphate synthase